MTNPETETSIHLCQTALMQRREFLQQGGVGLGAIALHALCSQEHSFAGAATNDKPLGVLNEFHVPPKIKNVIFLFMAGGPSQLELFEDKPVLREFHGKLPPDSLTQGRRFAFLPGDAKLLGSKRRFERVGGCGMELSELLPHHRRIVDKVCWLQIGRAHV